MEKKFKELPRFWRKFITILIFVTVFLTVGVIGYIWISVGSLISVMF